MPSKSLLLSIFLILTALFLSACGGAADEPTISPADAVLTAAAQTVAVQLTQDAASQPTDTPEPTETPELTPTETPAVTDTALPTNTQAPITGGQGTCDLAGFIVDVTVPDGTDFAPGEEFTKTWRLINNGSCTWNANYQVVFIDGEQMSAPSTLALTTEVAPGASLDISIDMIAPSTAGNYIGNWKLKNAAGEIFGLPGPFFVDIDVVGDAVDEGDPTATPESGSNTATLNAQDIGAVYDDGAIISNAYTGDDDSDQGVQAFVSFDISVIPSSATLDEVTVDFSSFDTLDNPFAGMGCLSAYPGVYFPLEAGDYDASPSGAVAAWCSAGDLSTAAASDAIKSSIQSVLGSSDYQLRLQFDVESDSDGDDDQLRFSSPKLIIEYTVP